MRRFLQHTAVFLLLLIALVLLMDMGNSSWTKKHSNFRLPETVTTVILGHSHPECAYNDSLIPGIKNLASSGEAYFYTYTKTKELLQQNPSFQNVLLEFSNNQINHEMNDWTWDEAHISKHYPKIASFISWQDKFFLCRKNPKGFLNAFAFSNKDRIDKSVHHQSETINDLGGYLFLVRDKTEALLKAPPVKDSLYDSSIIASPTNVTYLQKTIAVVQKEGKKVFLIRTPLHPKYTGYSNESIYQQTIRTQFSKLVYLDLSKFTLPNNYWGDLEHLNHKGAAVYSIWFAQLLQKGLLQSEHPQQLINAAITEHNLKYNQ